MVHRKDLRVGILSISVVVFFLPSHKNSSGIHTPYHPSLIIGVPGESMIVSRAHIE